MIHLTKKNSAEINQLIESIFKKHHVKTVLDLACGTGSQVFWLSKRGFDVKGYDISSKMLQIAKDKARKERLDLKFMKGDMRTTQAGQFDAVITIFNAIGHLTQEDFESAIKNIRNNLKSKGLYIFDIFNLSYLLKDDNITKLTIDWQTERGDTTAREIQYSTISEDGVLASYDIYHEQKKGRDPKITNAYQTLQIYSAKFLNPLNDNISGKVWKQFNIHRLRYPLKIKLKKGSVRYFV